MVQSLPGFINLCLNVCSPSQVLGDVYTEVLEAAHPLHRGPTDHKRSVGPMLSLPEVYNQLFSFAHIQRETVVTILSVSVIRPCPTLLVQWSISQYIFHLLETVPGDTPILLTTAHTDVPSRAGLSVQPDCVAGTAS